MSFLCSDLRWLQYAIWTASLSSFFPHHIDEFFLIEQYWGAAVCPWLAGMLAEHVGLWSLMPYVIILTAVMVCLWQALQVRPQVPHMLLEELG